MSNEGEADANAMGKKAALQSAVRARKRKKKSEESACTTVLLSWLPSTHCVSFSVLLSSPERFQDWICHYTVLSSKHKREGKYQ